MLSFRDRFLERVDGKSFFLLDGKSLLVDGKSLFELYDDSRNSDGYFGSIWVRKC